MEKIKIGAVSYLNTKPLIFGLENGLMSNEASLQMDYPSKIASYLLEDKIDIGLVPVAIIPDLKEYYVNSDYCIGATGEVASVCLFSEVPINEIKSILLDYQSRTSVALLKILLKEYWNLSPVFLSTNENYQSGIINDTAGLVIGDRALIQRSKSRYIYDLGSAWIEHTGLPFVFAAWISNKKLKDGFIKEFNEANNCGLERINEVINKNPFSPYDLKTYFTKNISYQLDQDKKKGLELFLSKLNSIHS